MRFPCAPQRSPQLRQRRRTAPTPTSSWQGTYAPRPCCEQHTARVFPRDEDHSGAVGRDNCARIAACNSVFQVSPGAPAPEASRLANRSEASADHPAGRLPSGFWQRRGAEAQGATALAERRTLCASAADIRVRGRCWKSRLPHTRSPPLRGVPRYRLSAPPIKTPLELAPSRAETRANLPWATTSGDRAILSRRWPSA